MNGFIEHLRITLRLHFRNRMALIYGYLFPLIFLAAFWVLYRHERVPLLRHMGELLTVSVLGGACFGLPTTLVSERERGVWRRYRLVAQPTWSLIVSALVARYCIVLTAGLLQLGIALAVGMTLPAHPAGLWLAFTLVAFAFIGLGLVIAALADNVPAVQALGQCIFLPMLIIGGVAVQLASLPAWAQHVSAFFPGRYAVEALQAAVTGPGFTGMRFSLLALALTGLAGCVTGAKLFRWDAQQRFASRAGKGWILPVFATWLAVGGLAEWRGHIAVAADAVEKTAPAMVPVAPATPTPAPAAQPPTPAGAVAERTRSAPVPPSPSPAPAKPVAEWQKLTEKDAAQLDYNLPPDEGIVAPIAPPDDDPTDFEAAQYVGVRDKLAAWPPGDEPDDVQRVRNFLSVCAVPDAIQLPIERYLPRLVFEQLLDIYPKEKLIKILTWIALHPEEGKVIDDISDLGVEGTAGDPSVVRERIYFYAVKFVARLTGRKRD